MEADQDDGEVGEVLDEADRALGDLDAEQHGDRAPGGRGAADGHQREQQAEGEPHEQEDQVRVELAELKRVQAVPRGVLVAGVRAGAGDDGADVEDRPGRAERRPGQSDLGAAARGRQRCIDAEQQPYGDADDGQRDEQVQRDHPRVQVGQHRDAADDGLGRDDQADQERHRHQVAAAAAPGREEGRDRDHREHAERACGSRTRSPGGSRARHAAGTTRPCSAARSGSRGLKRSAGRRRRSRRSRCSRPAWPRPGAGASAPLPVRSLPRERPGRRDGPDRGPAEQHDEIAPGDGAVQERVAHRLAQRAGGQPLRRPGRSRRTPTRGARPRRPASSRR